MAHWPQRNACGTHGRWRMLAALSATFACALGVAAATPQLEAPYALFVRSDGEMKSEYSVDQNVTVVQLALIPPGVGNTPSTASLVLRAQYAGHAPAAPPASISILVVPSVTADPNVIRGVQMQLTIERAESTPLTLAYFGKSWGTAEFVPPGGEVTRVIFGMSVAEFKAVLLGERVSGRVLNATFVFTAKQLAALRLFALTIGIRNPADKPPQG